MALANGERDRRSIRLPGFDYRTPGAYFVTTCTWRRESLFGAHGANGLLLNRHGYTVWDCWRELPAHYSHVEIDAFVVMPDHVHGILMITDTVGARHAVPLRHGPGGDASTGEGPRAPHAVPLRLREFGKPVSGDLSSIVRSFKSAVTREINLTRNAQGTPVWQRGYYETVVRSARALAELRSYIFNNAQFPGS